MPPEQFTAIRNCILCRMAAMADASLGLGSISAPAAAADPFSHPFSFAKCWPPLASPKRGHLSFSWPRSNQALPNTRGAFEKTARSLRMVLPPNTPPRSCTHLPNAISPFHQGSRQHEVAVDTKPSLETLAKQPFDLGKTTI